MKSKNLLSKFEESAKRLQIQLDTEIDELSMLDKFDAKHKAQKNMAETLHRLVTVINQLKKLEKIYEEEDIFNTCDDQQIIDEFIQKILCAKTNE